MVYALKEAWRVLVRQGVMIDLRPLCLDAPIDVLFKEKIECAGMADMSPDLEHEIAAQRAIETVVNAGLFDGLSVERFELAYYWASVRGMMAEIRARWLDDVIIDDRVIHRAYELFGAHRRQKKVRLLFQMHLAKYEKQGKSIIY